METKLTVLLLSIFLIICGSENVKAQVTIGSATPPNKDALLDLSEQTNGTAQKGLLMPRVSLQSTTLAAPMTAHVEGMTVYNTQTADDVQPGYYYNNGTRWIRLVPEAETFFYMPSIVLPLEPTGGTEYNTTLQQFEIPLYQKYSEQFALTKTTHTTKNPLAGTLPLYPATRLDFFVTYYDEDVFEQVAVDNNGLLTYKVKNGYSISDNTYMNIIFKVK
ncbi:hypothetical protein M2451_002421 [Dysgonomonas sp. PFB1-18]|uniref:hypothetical protein n=1 Tax=unclassified Dysgonomonas TaxID=2630389 RepID=UPI002475859F|nr:MULTISPECIES: hypothetical protein [unclassified Dysgonomonas]MDH6307187.1 hypothetical protein [Dysgonomonas sp. PF1-14]MDH6337106.1 hypothetical protein [Dysgonomonas sp. PF1-16]MDH6381092.1 hypothetical protein [Dysgonomonas sp. PFB1-18]MDH6396329.1 hypothetical protein [Dysgonomonas sp. PF1-23]